MRVLVACEESQAVTIAFRKGGHEAYSCDLLPCSGGHPEWHIQDDVLNHLADGWDTLIAHPPCTHLSKAGGWCWKYKEREINNAFQFILKLWNAPIERIAIENPAGWLNTHWQKPNQIINPYQFGDPWMKETCLWLKNLSALSWTPTLFCAVKETAKVKPAGNWVKPGNKRPWRRFDNVPEGGKGNAKDRSKTFPGIARAMAEQWGD
jgi:hypothetical protein